VTEEESAEPPPRRPPRPTFVHFWVDTAVAFLALIILGLILGFEWYTVALLSIVIGALAAPLTHRAEERALAARHDD
jgi:hypothetical protein